jgi:RHS repeat-associated protein
MVTTYTYDTNGALRMDVLQYHRKFLYDGWNLMAEWDGPTGTLVGSFMWGMDLSGSMQGAGGVGGLVSVKPSGAAAHFAAYDGDGNVAALVDGSAGTGSASYEYSPFGETIRATGTMALANPLRFSTKFSDDESDFLYYGYRYYNPSTGRWLNRDPLDEQGGRNLYGFCLNNSVDNCDADGRFVLVIGGVAVTVAECAAAATLACLFIPSCKDALSQLVNAGLRQIGECINNSCRPKRVCIRYQVIFAPSGFMRCLFRCPGNITALRSGPTCNLTQIEI